MTFLNITCLVDNAAQPHAAFWGEHAYSHPEHSGGLSAFLECRPGLPVYAHPDLFRERFSRREGHLEPKGLPLTPDVLRRQADLALLVVEPTVPGVHEWLAC